LSEPREGDKSPPANMLEATLTELAGGVVNPFDVFSIHFVRVAINMIRKLPHSVVDVKHKIK